jgi:ribosomal protein L11 methyltransferase
VSHFRRLSIRVLRADAESLGARLLAVVPAGLEEVDDGETVELAAYVPVSQVDELVAEFPGAAVRPVPEGWEDAWRSFHHPVTAGGLWIGPPWEARPGTAPAVVIDPGRAFGTGAHPTTRLCVELLAKTAASRGSLLDVGCGSGVLAIAGARLGFAPIVAADVDPVAVETTRANAAANGVEVDVRRLDALAEPLPEAAIAVANVLLRPVEAILARLHTAEAVTSGYLVGERPSHDRWAHAQTLELDGWAADRFCRLSLRKA